MKKRLLSLVIVIIVLALFAGCNQNEDPDEDKEEALIPVEAVKAEEGDLVIEKSIYGRTAPASTTPIMAKSPGEIDTLKVENGDEVKKDDLIASILTPMGKQNIYASQAGEIANLVGDEGSVVSDSEPLAVIIDTEEITIDFSVTSDAQTLFKKEDKLTAIIEEEEYEVEISSISSLPDDTGLYPIKATAKNEDDVLPGMIAVINVPEKRVKNAIILPTEAIVEETDGAFIYLIKDDQAVKTEIKIKESQSDKTAIEGEVKKGDNIVINGHLTLSDGSKVDVVKEGNKS